MIGFLVMAVFASGVPADLPFEGWFTAHGVKVEIARTPGRAPWLRGSAELPVNTQRIFSILTDFSHYGELFSPGLKRATVLDSEPGQTRLHLVWPYPFPLRNRDAVVSYRPRGEGEEGGRLVLTWESDARPGDPHEGIRIEHVVGETVIEPLGPDRCRVRYTYLGDLGGKFPAWAEDKAWREEPVQYVRAIRRRLELPDISH